jgi:hypothetical protein
MLSFLSVAGVLACQPGSQDGVRCRDLPQDFTVGTDGDPLIVPVTIKGKQYSFAVDTGCSYTFYDISMKSLLGPRVDTGGVESAHSRIALPRYRAPEAYLGSLPLPRNHPVIVADLSSSRRLMEIDIRGLLGMDFLRDYVMRIDFDRGILTFDDTIGSDPGQMLPLRCGKTLNVPHVDGDVCGFPVQFEIDIGSVWTGDAALAHRFFDSLADHGRLERCGTTGSTAIGSSGSGSCGKVASLKVGRFEHRGLFVSSTLRNSLGLDYWSRYNVTFDFPRQCLYFRESKQFDRAPRFWWSGLNFIRRHGEVVVWEAEPGLPAAEAGIQKEDVIISLAGMQAAKTRLVDLWKPLYRRTPTVHITLKRGGKVFSVVLVPKQNYPSREK